MTAKNQKKIIYPTVEDIVRINKAILGDKQALNELPESTRKQIEDMNTHLKPRPLERIPEILDEMKKLWLLVGDQRFGQFCMNYLFPEIKAIDANHPMWGQEDSLTLERIKATREKIESEIPLTKRQNIR